MTSSEIQIEWGHYGEERGWRVVCKSLHFDVPCPSREFAKEMCAALIAAYNLGKNDMREDFYALMMVKDKLWVRT